MIDEKYYINVNELMQLKKPKCKLPKPKLKPTIFVTGKGEWLPLVII